MPAALSIFKESHAEEFAKAARRSKAFHRGWVHPPTEPSTAADLASRRQGPSDFGFVVRKCDTGEITGYIEVTNIVRGPFQSAYLGFYVFKGFEREGYMKWALRTIVQRAWKTLQLHRLEANIQPANAACIALVKSLGFHKEGYSPRYSKLAGVGATMNGGQFVRGSHVA